MSIDMSNKNERLIQKDLLKEWKTNTMKEDFGKGKLKISLHKAVDTGNVPYSVTLYVIYLPLFCMAIYEYAGIKGILTKGYTTPIGAYEKALMETLLHICDNPEMYVSSTCTIEQYHQAIHMLADFVTHVKWYPNAQIRCEEV